MRAPRSQLVFDRSELGSAIAAVAVIAAMAVSMVRRVSLVILASQSAHARSYSVGRPVDFVAAVYGNDGRELPRHQQQERKET